MFQFFISSTFRDMMYERDLLRKKVLPILNKKAQVWGNSVSFCDLRWGVDTTDLPDVYADRKVLTTCLNEIDRSQYMIVFLGSRYGYVTDEILAEELLNLHDFYLEDYRKSITELEIEYGALRNNFCKERTLFYFRLPGSNLPEGYQETDPELAEKLHHLKKRIQATIGDHVRFYHWNTISTGEVALTMEDGTPLDRTIIQDAEQFLDREYSSLRMLSEFDRWNRKVYNWIDNQASMFCARTDTLSKLKRALHIHQQIALSGSSGMGKTTLMCKLALESNINYNVFFFPSGALEETQTSFDFMNKLTQYLEQLVKTSTAWNWGSTPVNASPSPDTTSQQTYLDQWQDYITSLFRQCNKPIVIFIDSLDQLSGESINTPCTLLPRVLPDHVHVIVSYIHKPGIISSNYHQIALPSLTEQDKQLVFISTLSQNSKSMNPEIVRLILQGKKGKEPLYYKLLSQIVILFDRMDFEQINSRNAGNMDSINEYLFDILMNCPDDMDGVVRYLLDTICTHIDHEFCHAILQLLAASHHGLRELDMQPIMEENGHTWSALTLHRFIHYMQDMLFIRQDSSIDFAHSVIRRCAESYLQKCQRRSLQNQILLMIQHLDDTDSYKYQELPCYAFSCGAKRYLIPFIEKHLYPTYMPMMEILACGIVDTNETMDPEWICQLCEEAYSAGGQLNFMSFMNYQIYTRINRSPKMQEYYLSAYHALYNLSMKLYQKHRDIQILDDMIETCIHLVDFALQTENHIKAKTFALQAVHCSTELFRIRQDDRRLSYICSSLLKLASVEANSGQLQQALEYRKQAYDLVLDLHDMLGVYTVQVVVRVCTEYLDSLIDCEQFQDGPDVIQFVMENLDASKQTHSLAVGRFFLKMLHFYSAPFNFNADPKQLLQHARHAEEFLVHNPNIPRSTEYYLLLAQFHHSMGAMFLHKKQLQNALIHTEKSMEIINQISNESDDHTELRNANQTNLALLYSLTGHRGKATSLRRILQKTTDDPALTVSLTIQQADNLWSEGKKLHALKTLEKMAYSLDKANTSDANLLQIFRCRGKQYNYCEDDSTLKLSDRIRYVEKFLTICQRIYPIFPNYFPDLAAAYQSLAKLYIEDGNINTALHLSLEYTEIARIHYEKDGPGQRLGNLIRYGQSLLFSAVLSGKHDSKSFCMTLDSLLDYVVQTYGSLDDAPNSTHLIQLQNSIHQLMRQ